MPGSLSERNEALAAEHARRVRCLLIEAGYEIIKTTPLDCGGRFAVIVETPGALIYSQEQVATGEAYELEAARPNPELEAVNGRLA